MEELTRRQADLGKDTKKHSPVGVLERGLFILGSFTQASPRLKMHEIATQTGLDRATVSRALRTLVQYGYLLKSADGTYSPGPTNLRLAALFSATSNIITRIQAPLDAISRQTGQTASFFSRSAEERICLARDRTQRSIRYFLEIGATAPLSNGGSAAKILRAYTGDVFPDADVIRNQRYYISWGEMHKQMASVAVPVNEVSGEFSGAVAVTGFKADLSIEELEKFALIAHRELEAAGFVTG